MKQLLLILGFAATVQADWLTDIHSDVDKINRDSILKRTRLIHSENEQISVSKYKLKDFEKTVMGSKSEIIDTITTDFFSKGNFVFARFNFLIADYIHKGVDYPGRAQGEITEIREYFKNENEGIKLHRSTDFFENSNIDSIRLELHRMPFDTIALNSENYQKIVRSYKRSKKYLRPFTN